MRRFSEMQASKKRKFTLEKCVTNMGSRSLMRRSGGDAKTRGGKYLR